MNKYKEFLSIKSIFYFCSLPLRLDSYKGCSHQCLYCFSQSLNNRNHNFFSNIIPADPNELRKIFATAYSQSSIVKECLNYKMPIHFGSVSDPFQPAENKFSTSYEFLKILSEYEYPTVISTKSDLLIKPKYLSIIQTFPTAIQISFSSFNSRITQNIEPNVVSPNARLSMIEKLSNLGFYVIVRIQPYLFPVETFSENVFDTLASCGAKSVVLEHLRIPTNSSKLQRTNLFEALNCDLLESYYKLGINRSRINFELNSTIKLQNLLSLRNHAHKKNLKFYVGDNDLHYLSDGYCCCGLPPEFYSNIFRANIGFSVFKGVRDGVLLFDNISNEWCPSKSIRQYLNSDCRITNLKNMKDYQNYKINNPLSSNSPCSFHGIEYTEEMGYTVDKNICSLMRGC